MCQHSLRTAFGQESDGCLEQGSVDCLASGHLSFGQSRRLKYASATLKPWGTVVSNDRNYEDLKARLGLKKSEETSAQTETSGVDIQAKDAPASDSIGEPPGERTPPGGFDLGLERGGAVLDEESVDIDKAAAAMLTAGGDDIAIKKSPAMKLLIVGLMVLGCAAALGVGYQTGVGNTEAAFTERQSEDAAALKKRLLTAKTGNGGQSIKDAVDAHANLISEVAKATDDVRAAPQLTDALLKKVGDELRRLHQGSSSYVKQNVIYNPERLIGSKVYSEKAVQLALKLDTALRTLHQTTLVMAREEAILAEFQALADVTKAKMPLVKKEWAFVGTRDKEGRDMGYLLGVKIQRDKTGQPIFRKDPIKVEPGYKLPAGAPNFRWQIQVTYDNPKQVGGDKGGWINADRIVDKDLRPYLQEPLQQTVVKHHEVYKSLVLRRLVSHVEAMKKAADDAVAVRQKVVEELEKL